MHTMASMIEAIEIKRKMYFEYENAPYHCLDVDVSKPTARGGQTLVRVKMRNLLTRAVFDRTFKAGEKFYEPDLGPAARARTCTPTASGYNFMDQASFETLTLDADTVGDDRFLLADNVDRPDPDLQRPPDRHPVPAARRADGRPRPRPARAAIRPAAASPRSPSSKPGMEIQVPLFIKEGEKIKVHTETREFAGRA